MTVKITKMPGGGESWYYAMQNGKAIGSAHEDDKKGMNQLRKLQMKEIVKKIETELHCNCDLDNWQPENDTGHSCVCRIHKQAKTIFKNQNK